MMDDDDPWAQFRRALRRERYPRRTIVADYPVRVSHAARAALVEQCQRAKRGERAKRVLGGLLLALMLGAGFGLVHAGRWALTLGSAHGEARAVDSPQAAPEHAAPPVAPAISGSSCSARVP